MDPRSQVSATRSSDTDNPAARRLSNSADQMPLNDPDLRLILANRFKRMSHLHDEARAELLAPHPTQSK